MKVILMMLLISLVMSCGKKGPSAKSQISQDEEECKIETAADCETVRGNPAQVDLLESMIDVSISTTSNEVLFRESKSSMSRGRSIECETKVLGGTTYRYDLRGNELDLWMEGTKYTFGRLSEGDGLRGAWSWKGYGAGRIYRIKSITFLSESRIIIKNHCEN